MASTGSAAILDPRPSSEEEQSFEGEVVGGKYRVGRLVGSGGMGTVWLCDHEQLGTRLAIKGGAKIVRVMVLLVSGALIVKLAYDLIKGA